MKQKRKQKAKHSAKHSVRKLKHLPPPPIPTHKKMNLSEERAHSDKISRKGALPLRSMGFNSIGLYGEGGSAHFASLPESETEGSILLRQVEQRGGTYAKKKIAKNLLFSIGCGILAGAAAFFALSFALGLEGLVLYGASFVAFAIATAVAFGSSTAC